MVDTTLLNEWQPIILISDTLLDNHRLYASCQTNTEATIYFDGMFSINMTALGIEDYTEEQMLDLVRGGYFEGLTSVENLRFESVGRIC